MRREGLVARPMKRRKAASTVGSAFDSGIAPNVLQREFQAAAPDPRWVADLTYEWTLEGWLYVAVVLDLYSRRVVGFLDARADDLGAGGRCVADGDMAARLA